MALPKVALRVLRELVATRAEATHQVIQILEAIHHVQATTETEVIHAHLRQEAQDRPVEQAPQEVARTEATLAHRQKAVILAPLIHQEIVAEALIVQAALPEALAEAVILQVVLLAVRVVTQEAVHQEALEAQEAPEVHREVQVAPAEALAEVVEEEDKYH